MADRGACRPMAGSMKVWVLGSGSRGNATVIDNGSTRVLVDAGFSSRELKRRFATAGIAPESRRGGDRDARARRSRVWRGAVARVAGNGRVHATAGTVRGAPELVAADVRTFDAGATLTFGTMNVHTVPISHDATEPIAVVATDIVSGARAAVVMDLGRMTPQLRDAIRDVDMLVLESNHDEAMLARGPYPISVQRRIAERDGTSEQQRSRRSSRARARTRDLQHLVLAHLSEQCNTPDHALASVCRGAGAVAIPWSPHDGVSRTCVHGAFVAGRARQAARSSCALAL